MSAPPTARSALCRVPSLLRQMHSAPSPEPSPAPKKQKLGVSDAAASRRDRKRVHNFQKAYGKQVAKHGVPPLQYDILEMLGEDTVAAILKDKQEFDRIPPFNEEVSVRIERLSAHGDGLAVTPQRNRVLVVPFALPGELVRVYPYASERLYYKARIVEMLETNTSLRDDSLVQCRYFGQCGGCQYQMIPYSEQLLLKQKVVENAFKYYFKLDPALVPPVLPTMASPRTMGYRTKLTPHFDLPGALRRKSGPSTSEEEMEKLRASLPIGFDNATTGRVMDIEECSIGTPVLNEAMTQQRTQTRQQLATYKNGATILLRDSLPDVHASEDQAVAVTDHKATVYERVGDTTFSTPAGAFFQNNRSIIPPVIEYVKEQIQRSSEPRYLVDTYCGSGLFALTLAPLFQEVAGVEISASSIECAKENARLNEIDNVKFLAGEAEKIFATTVVIDPPRRGCDTAFLDQLVALRPKHIVYVSCNVHVRVAHTDGQTQARDIGQLVQACPAYRINSVRGFDFFPQTQYVARLTAATSKEFVC